jgi:hypothetical protein
MINKERDMDTSCSKKDSKNRTSSQAALDNGGHNTTKTRTGNAQVAITMKGNTQ